MTRADVIAAALTHFLVLILIPCPSIEPDESLPTWCRGAAAGPMAVVNGGTELDFKLQGPAPAAAGDCRSAYRQSAALSPRMFLMKKIA